MVAASREPGHRAAERRRAARGAAASAPRCARPGRRCRSRTAPSPAVATRAPTAGRRRHRLRARRRLCPRRPRHPRRVRPPARPRDRPDRRRRRLPAAAGAPVPGRRRRRPHRPRPPERRGGSRSPGTPPAGSSSIQAALARRGPGRRAAARLPLIDVTLPAATQPSIAPRAPGTPWTSPDCASGSRGGRPARPEPADRGPRRHAPGAGRDRAEHDPLRDGGDLYAQRLTASGVPVVHRTERGLVHNFAQSGTPRPPAPTPTHALAARRRPAFLGWPGPGGAGADCVPASPPDA